ncbi:MAG: hypothetical protein J5802_07135 [Butyrivibrio sp.]|nr:hypothetical protein [Butyrivibrio sp.]
MNSQKNESMKLYISIGAIAVFVIIVIISVAIGVVKTKQHRAEQYNDQNTAFRLKSDIAQRGIYHGADDLELKELVVQLFVYNQSYAENQLTINDIFDYLSAQHESDSKLKKYSRYEDVKFYIDWSVRGGRHITDNYLPLLIRFLENNSEKIYSDISYEEVEVALEEYRNSPEYIPPRQFR